MKAAVQQPPAAAGIELANWYWQAVHQFVWERFGGSLSRSSCLNWLRRLGFVLKRPKKRLVKADEAKREAFVAEYAALRDEAGRTGGKVFFADEAHFRADAELRGKWVLRGEPALVDSTSPRYGEKASYYWAVCLETGEVEWMELEGNSNSETSAAFLGQLRERRAGPPGRGSEGVPADAGAEPEAGEPAGLQPGLQCRCGHLGLGEGGGYREPVLGKQGQGAGEGRQLPRRSDLPERRGETPLPHRPAIKGQRPTAPLPHRLSEPQKCTSHLGFGLALACSDFP